MYLEEMGLDTPETQRAATRYAAFLDAAFDPARRRFRNFLSFDRRWLDEEQLGSDDCFGRALRASGACVGRSKQRSLQSWAMELFQQRRGQQRRAPFAAGLGRHADWHRRIPAPAQRRPARQPGASNAHGAADRSLRAHGFRRLAMVRGDPHLRQRPLPRALILSGRGTNDAKAQEIGLRSLSWLAKVQRAPRGHFRPIGSNGFFPRGGQRADFDQQPIEAQATVSACVEAYRATEDASWLNEARLAFEWFLGRNDLGLELYDASTGGCHDGLQPEGVNENQGAESTLAFLLSLAEMNQLESSMAAFRRAAETSAEPEKVLLKEPPTHEPGREFQHA